MLSIEECRTILGKPELTDEQIAEIRDTLCAFAHTLIDGFLRDGLPTSPRRHERSEP